MNKITPSVYQNNKMKHLNTHLNKPTIYNFISIKNLRQRISNMIIDFWMLV